MSFGIYFIFMKKFTRWEVLKNLCLCHRDPP
jgi:hypothetical protein